MYIYSIKTAQHSFNKPNILSKEPNILSKEPYIPSKEPYKCLPLWLCARWRLGSLFFFERCYISSPQYFVIPQKNSTKETYINSTKETSILSKEYCILFKNPLVYQNSAVFYQKTLYSVKRALYMSTLWLSARWSLGALRLWALLYLLSAKWCHSAKEPNILSKEPYNLSNEPSILSKEP